MIRCSGPKAIRARFATLVTALSVSACVTLAEASYADALKGVAGEIQNAPLVGAVWAYDWGSGMPSMPPGVEYVPMSWGYYGADQTSTVIWVTSLKNAGA